MPRTQGADAHPGQGDGPGGPSAVEKEGGQGQDVGKTEAEPRGGGGEQGLQGMQGHGEGGEEGEENPPADPFQVLSVSG